MFNAINVVSIGMEVIITPLKTDILNNEQTGRHPDGEPKDIHQRKRFLAHQNTPCYFKMDLDHRINY
jgi:hypothetical protein